MTSTSPKIRIFMPIQPRSTGGSSTFAIKFKQGMEDYGHSVYFEKPREYDVLLVVASCPASCLIDAKLKFKPIIHRLDGVYYPMSVAGKKWRQLNLPLQLIHHFFANFTIFQSEFSQHSVHKFLGQNRFNQSRIIYNGVDVKRFSPAQRSKSLRDNPHQHIFITTGRFRRPDQLDPIISAFKIYRAQHEQNAKLYIIGNHEIKQKQTANPDLNIVFLKSIPNQILPQYLSASDVFLYTGLNPPCPNNVIEALACGLPVCGIDDGAMRELIIPEKTGRLIPSTVNNFFEPRKLDLNEFASNMHTIMIDRIRYSKNAQQHARKSFSLEKMISEYENVISSLT